MPRRRLRTIVTARLERYRPETEAWLARAGIAYDRLVMLDLATDAERRRTRPQGRFKAAVFAADAGAALFVESESWQAREIARAAGGKAVFDYQARVMLDRRRAARAQPAAPAAAAGGEPRPPRGAADGRGGGLVDRLQRLDPSGAGGDDLVWVGLPDEGPGCSVVLVDEAVDGGLEVDPSGRRRA